VADIVDQGQSFDEIGVDAQRRGDSSGNLGHFECVGQTIAEVVGEACAEYLGLRLQPPERSRMNDAVAVSRVFAPVGMRGFRKPPAAGGDRVYCPRNVCAKRFDCRNLRKSGGGSFDQDCGASAPRPRSASSATLVFG
jgi:hypothetical protein